MADSIIPNTLNEQIATVNENIGIALKADFRFTIPGNSSRTLKVESDWSYAYILFTASPNSQAQTGTLHFINGYATASRGADINIGGNSIITVNMSSTTNKWITVTNTNNGETTLTVINLDPTNNITFSV